MRFYNPEAGFIGSNKVPPSELSIRRPGPINEDT